MRFSVCYILLLSKETAHQCFSIVMASTINAGEVKDMFHACKSESLGCQKDKFMICFLFAR